VADTNNPQIIITAQDQATPAFDRIIAGLQRLEQAGESNAAWVTQLSTLLGTQQQAAQATTQSTNQLATAYTAMAQAIQQQTQGYVQANAALIAHQQAQQHATAATQAWSAAWQQFLSIGGALGLVTSLEGALRSVIAFGTSVVEVGAKIQGLQLAFTGLHQSTENGAAAFGFIVRESQRLGLELLSTATTFRNFEAAAKGTVLEGQAARDIFTGFATAARGLGIQGADLTRVFFALDRMMQTNVINMRELRQLSMAMPGSMEAFAHALGTTTAGLAEMTKSGTLLATESLPAVAEEMRRMSSGIAENIGVQATTAFARLGNEVVLLKNRIAESGVLEAVTAITAAAAKALEAGRQATEARQRDAGGPLPALPGNLQGLAPDIQRRQREIAQLQAQLNPSALAQMAEIPDLGGPLRETDREAMRQRIRGLLQEQEKAIKDFQDHGLEPPSVGMPAPGPLASHLATIQQLMVEGQKKLVDIDLNATFLPSLTTAEDKLKSWQETLKAIREEFEKIPEALRRAQVNPPSGAISPFRAMIGPLAAERGLDPALVEALITQESGNNPQAVSRQGAKGLGQFMPGTAAQYGITGREFDPESNIRATVNYLADLLKQFSGDVNKALTAYNAGPRGGGIPQAAGENATFAREVLARLPSSVSGVLGQATGQEAQLRAAVDAGKPDRETLAQTMATGRAHLQAIDEEIRATDQAAAALQRLIAGYTQTKEARDQDTAAVLQARFPQNEAIQQAAETVLGLARTREAYKAEVEALDERFVALKQTADATRAAEQAQADYTAKLRDTLAVLNAPHAEKVETQLRALAARQGVQIGPQEDALLGAITARSKTLAQEKEMEQIAKRLAGNLRQTFDSLWEQVFTGGVTSFRQLGQVVVQSLQKMFAQLTSQIMNMLLNAATGTTNEQGGWEGVLARGVVGVGLSALGGSPASTAAPGFEAMFAAGGVAPHGFGSILHLAGGGIVQRPSLATLAELGTPEAVVPLSGGRSIPVDMRGSQAQPQPPIVIEIHNDYSNALPPSQLKTGKREIIKHIIDDYRSNGPIRRTFKAG
jgi:tape measure domain-containing protein